MAKVKENPFGILPFLVIGGGIAAGVGYGVYRALKKKMEPEPGEAPLLPASAAVKAAVPSREALPALKRGKRRGRGKNFRLGG